MARPTSITIRDPRVIWIVIAFTRAQRDIARAEYSLARGALSEEAYSRQVSGVLNQVDYTWSTFLKGPYKSIFMEGVMLHGAIPPLITTGLRRVLLGLQAETYEDIARMTQYLRADLKRVIRDVARAVNEAHVTRGLSIPQSQRLIARMLQRDGFLRETRSQFAVNRLLEKGGKPITGLRFRDKSGRHWRLDTYGEMLARTKSAQAYNLGNLNALRGRGVTQVQVHDGTQDDACRAVNGTIQTVEWAMENPIAHPCCTRAFSPVVASMEAVNG